MNLNAVLIIIVGGLGATAACWGFNARERLYALLAFALHVVASFGQTWLQEVYYLGVSDAIGYQRAGESIARLLDYDFWGFAPELVKLFLHVQTAFSFPLSGEGSGTGTAAAVAGAFAYIAGPTLLDLCLVTTWISWFGLVCWYRVAREELPAREHMAAMLGLMFVPSAVFWGAAFAKEALVIGGFGVLGLSTYRLLRNGRWSYLPGLAIGLLVVAMIKPYTLFPFILGVSTFIYVSRASAEGAPVHFRPLYGALAVAVAIAGVSAMGTAFPEYSAENISGTFRDQQQSWDENNGGSTIARVGADSEGLSQQASLLPLALVNSFFRPAIFEANGGPALGAALETTLLFLAVVALMDGKGGVTRTLTSSPLLAASTVFIFVFAAAVGLTTSNLGSLSRYRVPMVPFCATVLLIIHQRRREMRMALRTAENPFAYHRRKRAT